MLTVICHPAAVKMCLILPDVGELDMAMSKKVGLLSVKYGWKMTTGLSLFLLEICCSLRPCCCQRGKPGREYPTGVVLSDFEWPLITP